MKRPQTHPASTTNEVIYSSEDRVASMFQPDTVATDQYFENLRRKTYWEPETRLMLAILEDAIHCYQDNFFPRNPVQKRLLDEAKEWITSPEDSWVFSFESVCEVLRVNPAFLREGLFRWRPKFGVSHAVEPKRVAV